MGTSDSPQSLQDIATMIGRDAETMLVKALTSAFHLTARLDTPPTTGIVRVQVRDSDLPDSLLDIADIVGTKAAIALSRARGGTRIYVPASASDKHWLVQAMGRSAADKFMAAFRCCQVNVPLCLATPSREVETTLSSRDAALKLGVTQRTIHRRRRKVREQAKRKALK